MSYLKALAALSLAALFYVPTAISAELSPVGSWQTVAGDTRFQVSLCGNGKELCAKLVWLHPDLRTKENMAYLNKLVVSRAQPNGQGTWSGTVELYGEQAAGNIRQLSSDVMTLTGCQAIVCQSFRFIRI